MQRIKCLDQGLTGESQMRDPAISSYFIMLFLKKKIGIHARIIYKQLGTMAHSEDPDEIRVCSLLR